MFHKTSSVDSSESFSDAHCEILVFLSPPQALGLVSSPEKLFRKSTTVELVCYRRNACSHLLLQTVITADEPHGDIHEAPEHTQFYSQGSIQYF